MIKFILPPFALLGFLTGYAGSAQWRNEKICKILYTLRIGKVAVGLAGPTPREVLSRKKMRHYLIRQLLCDACLRGRIEEIRQLVFKNVGIIIEYRVPLDFGMQLKPCLNFISPNVVFFVEQWSDVETRHYPLLNDSAAVFETTPGGREHDFETWDGANNVLHNLSEARVDAHKAAMALLRSQAIYDPVDVEKEHFHAAPWNETPLLEISRRQFRHAFQ